MRNDNILFCVCGWLSKHLVLPRFALGLGDLGIFVGRLDLHVKRWPPRGSWDFCWPPRGSCGLGLFVGRLGDLRIFVGRLDTC